MPCMCGDTQCPSCGAAQGTYIPNLRWYDFQRFTIEMSLDDAMRCSHQGSCDDDVIDLLCKPYIVHQLAEISEEDLRDELREYGAWDDVELSSLQANRARIVWITACNIREEDSIEEKTS